MFVGERMSRPVITISPDAPINDVLAMFRKEHIRRAPVIKNGKLVGIVTENDLIHASPSSLTTLSVWEMHYLISKIKIKDIMTKKVLTISRDTPIEEAARIMADKSLGGLPVTDGKKVVGMITETDLFKVFLELMGARDKGIRVTVSVESKPGQLAKITKAIANAGGNFVSFGFFAGEDAASKIVTFKVEGVKKEEIKKILGNTVKKFWDIRES
jgi:acetoin utilization protein AcuB